FRLQRMIADLDLVIAHAIHGGSPWLMGAASTRPSRQAKIASLRGPPDQATVYVMLGHIGRLWEMVMWFDPLKPSLRSSVSLALALTFLLPAHGMAQKANKAPRDKSPPSRQATKPSAHRLDGRSLRRRPERGAALLRSREVAHPQASGALRRQLAARFAGRG